MAAGVKPEDVQAVLQALAHSLFSPHSTDPTRAAADACLQARSRRAAPLGLLAGLGPGDAAKSSALNLMQLSPEQAAV